MTTVCQQLNTFKLFIDFDSTLFNTRRFGDDLWRKIATLANRPYLQVKADAVRYQTDPILHGYDFEAHITSYDLDATKMWRHLDEVVQSADYLYKDSAGFIQALRSDGYDPEILSFGETRFQRAKIVPSLPTLVGPGLDERALHQLAFDVVLRKKGEYIADTYPGYTGILVDDVPNQNLPAGFTEIYLDRSRTLSVPEEMPGGYTVCGLAQARQAIHLTTAKSVMIGR